MSDMLENGSSGGASPLPPSESHDEYLELCATASTGSLSAAERRRLQEHLSRCDSCRQIMAQYEAVIGKVIPALAPDPLKEKSAPSGWSLEQAEAALFARLSESEGFPQSQDVREQPRSPEPFAPAKMREPSGEALWRHMWGQFAAAVLLIATLGLISFRIGVRRGLDLAPHASMPTPSMPSSAAPIGRETSNSAKPSTPKIQPASPQVAALRAQLEEKLEEIARLKAQLAQTLTDLNGKEADRSRLALERADLSQQLELARGNLQSIQQKLDSAASQGSQDSARVAALQQRIDQLTASMSERDQEVARERELLDHDRDIRELMGSRDLYIAEVYDVAKTGDTQKPFGRVFYTRGKSLIFYAYELDQQAGIKSASTFQAWGRRGPDRDQAVNLGIFYQDNANKKRWVVKSDNPKSLAQIDAVFVTVEPNGGSSHPSGKPLLFAYLRIEPNHP
jgi:hypothetical protein